MPSASKCLPALKLALGPDALHFVNCNSRPAHSSSPLSLWPDAFQYFFFQVMHVPTPLGSRQPASSALNMWCSLLQWATAPYSSSSALQWEAAEEQQLAGLWEQPSGGRL